MATNLKQAWFLKKYAKFLHEEELQKLNDEKEYLDVSCKGFWKESFYLPCSKTWVKGVAKGDSLLISYQLENGNTRKFRIQFCAEGDRNGVEMRKQCTDMLQKYLIINDFEHKEKKNEVVKINEITLSRVNSRKGYVTSVPKVDLKEVLSLCLTDISFPSFVAEVEQMMQDIGKN